MSTDAALDRIADKLRQAQEQGARPFGVEGHGMRIEPPLSSEALAAVESRLGVKLPEEYRGFVTRVGDGGAGPGFGMFSLESALRKSGVERDPGVLRALFPHIEWYNPDDDPEVDAEWDRMDAGAATADERKLYTVRQRSGSLVLCHEGCGYLHFLIVTGPARGTMWIDSRGSDQGFIPLNVTFLEWYERWLDDVLADGPGTWWLGPPVYPGG
ncbi:MAG TPA: SMI1/KNR4 family protein [Longimicrobium sp.]|nr:SMI1/KNR4 family protein [Longimicrobium sp.]